MKKRLAIAGAAVALAATVTSLAAGGRHLRDDVADALPAYEILNNVRALGLRPSTGAHRRGHYYVLHAYDRRGLELRVVADAQFGEIVEVAPLVVPRYDSRPRIIHVPQPSGRGGRGQHGAQ
jgi:hypothetical protein